jgi:hypothetical protein
LKRRESTRREEKNEVVKGNSGFFIAFDPVKSDGEIEQFRYSWLMILNQPVSFSYCFLLINKVNFQLDKIVLPYQAFLLHIIDYDTLNEMPAIELKVRDVMNNQFHGELNQRIKPQNFFNKLAKMPLTGTEAYVYKVNLKIRQQVVEHACLNQNELNLILKYSSS